jgi:hypothetical protein
LSEGFPLLGPIPPGTGWARLDAPPPAVPTPLGEFLAHNATYAAAGMKRGADEHSAVMLDQVLEERKLGRIRGPFKAPPAWGTASVPLLPQLQEPCDLACPLREAPPGLAAAMAFAIVTHNDDGIIKVRRGEDWRRSGHNGAAQVSDRLHHHTVDSIAGAARAAHEAGFVDLRPWTTTTASSLRRPLSPASMPLLGST